MITQHRIWTPPNPPRRALRPLILASITIALLVVGMRAALDAYQGDAAITMTTSARQIRASWTLNPAAEGVRLVSAGWPSWSREPYGWVEQWLPAAPVGGRQEVFVLGEGPACVWADELAWAHGNGGVQRVVLRRIWIGCGWP